MSDHGPCSACAVYCSNGAMQETRFMDLANTIDEFCEQGFERFFTWRRIFPQIGVPGLTLLVVHQHVASAIGLEVSI